MLKTKQILVFALALALAAANLSGCGQPGALYLPTEPAATQRATLPQTLTPANPFVATPTRPTTNNAPQTVTPTSTPTPASAPATR